MEDLKKHLTDITCLAFLTVLFIGLGVFGAVNWGCYNPPERIIVVSAGFTTTKTIPLLTEEQYTAEVERRKADAIMPLPYAATLTVVSFVAAGACLIGAIVQFVQFNKT